jgi:alpha-1,3-glucosyltransferase
VWPSVYLVKCQLLWDFLTLKCCSAEKINPSWVALDSSRGIEGYNLRLFMRYTVLIADVLIYFPAIFVFCKLFYNNNKNNNSLQTAAVALVMLLQPSLILIDHGHFQYPHCIFHYKCRYTFDPSCSLYQMSPQIQLC